MVLLRPLIIFVGLLLVWQLIVWITASPPYILPSPDLVAKALVARSDIIFGHAGTTFAEIILGLLCGTILGTVSALIMGYFRPAQRWLMPVLVTSQAIPVFALAPVLASGSATAWRPKSRWRH